MSLGEAAGLRTKLARFDWRERRALAEAVILLALAAPMVRLLPLRWIGKIASTTPLAAAPASADLTEVLTWTVGWAVDRAAKRSVLRAKCFEQGVTAQIMLRRRGIDSTMFYGVALAPGAKRPIRAHVWVETERFPVIGEPEPDDFALLASWPEGRRPAFAKVRA